MLFSQGLLVIWREKFSHGKGTFIDRHISTNPSSNILLVRSGQRSVESHIERLKEVGRMGRETDHDNLAIDSIFEEGVSKMRAVSVDGKETMIFCRTANK